MTNQEINRLSAPVVQAYRDMEDEVLRLIAKQISKDGRLRDTSKWRIRQLARAGEVNRQALDIIDSYAGGISAEVHDAILAAAEGEVGRLDDAMMNLLSEKGRMTADVQESLDAFERQSRQELNVRNAEIADSYAGALAERCNLVNTVMGYSAQSAYSQAIRDISAEADRQGVLNVLNEGAADLVSGNMSLQEATRKAIHKLAEKGLPGFVDRAGRQWSPEAYVRMDLRSTMGNAARAAQDARCDAYGIDLIEVSSHLGARPKCAPYQGRIFSRDGSRGVTEDLNGNPIEYIPLSETSYGEPDGLFGINCGHQQYPFMPGLSLKTYYPYDEAENAERYEETQRQRALERKIRADKRECMMLQEAGDTEGLQKAAGQLRADRDRYKDFCKEKGLAAHNENTQVLGYDRKASMKTIWAERKGLTESNESDIISSKINPIYNSSTVTLTDHVLDQAINRGVTVDGMLDAVDNGLMDKPVKVDEFGRPSFQRIGEKATVAINPDSYTVISTWPTGKDTLKRVLKKVKG
ncbi:MAG: phage minor capsid protein [Oscillospiraceae bacterium]|nr:phage minor capsid protein [Oscillospiraceae bacterium]